MNLSKRLKAIADLVDGKNVIDVGCDHGYLDIYLTKNNIANITNGRINCHVL